MKIYFTLKNNRIDSYSMFPMQIQEGETQYETETDIEFEKLVKCDYVDGELVYNTEYEKEDAIHKLRVRRERECFPYVNRGQIWYTRTVNTAGRLKELTEWYLAWLNVTETLEVPTKPSWLE